MIINWFDGIDGLSGGMTFIGSITIFLLSLKPEVNQPPMAILSMILAGVALGFIIFNFNPSRIMAGTSGSMFMGFSLAVLAIFAGTKVATAILILSIPLIDFLWVIIERKLKNRSIFSPDSNHLHHKLLGLNYSQKQIALYLYILTATIAAVALNTKAFGKSVTFMIVGFIMVSFLFFITRKITINSKL